VTEANFHIPVELAELLHATLGPLGDVLEQEGHRWSPTVRRVVSEYVRARNEFLAAHHGRGATVDVLTHTEEAAERVCALTESALREEEDFFRWSEEVSEEAG
jgi:hypothetical protein